MANYIPIKSIKQLVPLLNKPIDKISEERWSSVANGLGQFKSPKPQVSMVLICRNEEAFLFACLASMAEIKSPKEIELIVVNNGSTDRSQEILDRLNVKSVLEETPGWAEARQAGVNEAKGEIILSADGDNLYPPTWVDAMVDPLLKNEKAVISCGQYCFYTFDDEYPPFMSVYQNFRLLNCLMRHSKRPHLNCLGGNMALRKSVIDKVGGYEMGIGRGEDGGLAFRMQEHGKILFMRSKESYSYSSLRNVISEGTLWDAFTFRLKAHSKRLLSYLKTQKS